MSFYLLSAGISGVKNIHKRILLEFYKKTIDKSFDPDKYRVKGVFGENGFGKTAIITAFYIYQALIVRSDYIATNPQYLLETINKMTKEFSFECEFAHIEQGTISILRHNIRLGFVGSSFQILDESLDIRNGNNPKSEYTPVFSVENGKLIATVPGTDIDTWNEATINLLSKSTLSSLLLGKSELMDNGVVANSVYMLLDFASHMFVSLRNEDEHAMYFITNNSTVPEQLQNEVVGSYSLLKEKKVLKPMFESYERRVHGMEKFIKLFKSNLKSIDIVRQEAGEYYSCQLNMNYGDYMINSEFESEGIKKLISIYDALRSAANGGIVFIDEMDANVNSIYLETLIEYMMLYGKGQLCFTSHNIDIMNVLKDNKHSIDFLNSNQEIVRWINNGNKSPVNTYKNGLIEGMPYNIFATDFIGVFGEA